MLLLVQIAYFLSKSGFAYFFKAKRKKRVFAENLAFLKLKLQPNFIKQRKTPDANVLRQGVDRH